MGICSSKDTEAPASGAPPTAPGTGSALVVTGGKITQREEKLARIRSGFVMVSYTPLYVVMQLFPAPYPLITNGATATPARPLSWTPATTSSTHPC